MMKVTVCCDGPDGDRSTRGTIAGRSPLLAAQHSRHAGSDFPSLDIGDGSFARVMRYGGCRRTTGHRTAFKFHPTIRGVGSLIPIGFHRALTVCQDTARGFADRLQVSILSAGSAGLAGCFDRHEATKEKFPHDGKTGTRPGNLTARKRNAY